MTSILFADFKFTDAIGRIWEFETDGVAVKQRVLLTDGNYIVSGIIEKSKDGSLVARLTSSFMDIREQSFVLIPIHKDLPN